MKNYVIFLVLILGIMMSMSDALAQDKTCMYFFYGEGCPHCGKVEPYITGLSNDPDLEIYSFEIYNNRSNAVVLNDMFNTFNIPESERGIPVVFIDNEYLLGDGPIFESLDEKIDQNGGAICPSLMHTNATGIIGESSHVQQLKSLSYLTIISAAIVDSINPCAIAVLLILMTALLAAGNKNKALWAGFAFTASIYIAYFLFGMGLFSVLKISGLSFWFYQFIGFLAIVIGLANIKDFFWYGGGGFVMEIPRSWRPTLKKLLGGVTSPFGAFIMGFVVCLFELPCTGGPYLFILGLLAERTTQLLAIPILLVYNLFFITPLILITLLMYFGFTTVDKTNEWKEKNIRLLHLIAGIVMIVLGLLVTLRIV